MTTPIRKLWGGTYTVTDTQTDLATYSQEAGGMNVKTFIFRFFTAALLLPSFDNKKGNNDKTTFHTECKIKSNKQYIKIPHT